MPLPLYHLTCIGNDLVANDVYQFSFVKPPGFTFRPGQFVLFDIPLVDAPSDIQPRAFSVASTPEEAELMFVAKLIPGGRASRWIKSVLRPGTVVATKGPFGTFTLDARDPRDILFVATGTGVAPFRSQIRSALASGDRRRMDLVFGVAAEADLFWQEELTELTKRHENFFLHIALSNASDSWTGHRGWVQAVLPHIAPDLSQKSLFICGNPNMTKDVKRLCIEEWHVPKEHVHVEGYI